MHPDDVQSQEAPLNYGTDKDIQMGPTQGEKHLLILTVVCITKELYLYKAMRYICYGILCALRRWSVSPILHLKGGGYRGCKASALCCMPQQ